MSSFKLQANEEFKIRKFLEEKSLYQLIREIVLYPDFWPEIKKYGHFKVITWLYSSGFQGWDSQVFDFLAQERTFPHLEYLIKNGCKLEFSVKAIEFAAESGDLKLVEWLHKNNYGFQSDKAMILAAKNRHIEIVEFLCNNGYPYTSTVMEWAASSTEFGLVRFLNKNRTEPITRKTLSILLDYLEETDLY